MTKVCQTSQKSKVKQSVIRDDLRHPFRKSLYRKIGLPLPSSIWAYCTSCWLCYFKGCEDFRFSCNGYGHSIMERNAGIFSANENSPWANYQRQKGWTGCRAAQSHVGFIRHVLHNCLFCQNVFRIWEESFLLFNVRTWLWYNWSSLVKLIFNFL